MFAKSYGHAGRIALAVSLVLSPAFAQSEFQSNRYDLLAALDPVVVTASRFEEPQGQATVLVDVIARQEIQESGLANVTELLDRLPGVNVTRQYGRLGIDTAIDIGYLGGSAHHRTLVLIDGVRLNDIDDGTLMFGSVPLSSIERIELRRAGGGVLFGDRALGGVVNIITKPEKENKTSVDATLGSFRLRTAGASVSRVIGDATARLDVNRSLTDGYRRDSSQAQTGVSSRILMPTRLGELGLSLRASDENLLLPQSISIGTFRSDPKNPGSYRTNSWRESKTGIISLDTSYGAVWSSVIRMVTEDLDRKSVDIYATTIYQTVRNTVTVDLKGHHKDLTGLFGAEIFDAKSESNRNNRNAVNQQSKALYASVEKEISDAKLMAGFRTQEMENKFIPSVGSTAQNSRNRLSSWSLAGRYPVLGGILRSGVQSSFAFPNADQLYTFNSDSPYAPKNIYPGVDPMRSREFQISWLKQTGKPLFEISFRRILVKDEIGFRTDCDGADDCNDNLYDTTRDIVTLRYGNSLWRGAYFDISSDFINPRIDSGVNAGNQLPLTPRHVTKLGVHQDAYLGRLSLYAHHRSAMYQSTDDSHRYPQIPSRTVYDLGWNSTYQKSVRLQFWLRNLTDKRYYDFAQYGSVSPADGRSVEASISYRF